MEKFRLIHPASFSLTKKIIFYSFIIVLCLLLSQKLFTRYLHNYVFQEWLIDYSQGFIRRGLTGSFFLFIYHQYKVNHDFIFTITFFFCYAVFLLVLSIYLWKFKRYKNVINLENLAVLLFLPSLILFPINDMRGLGKKEFLFFLGLGLNLFLLEKSSQNLQINPNDNSIDNPESLNKEVNKYCYRLFIGYNLLSIPTALTHEAILFLGIPINMMITASFLSLKFRTKSLLKRTLLIYLPTIFVASLCIIFPGNKAMVLAMCHSWKDYNYPSWYNYSSWSFDCIDKLPYPLAFFTLSLKEVIPLVFEINILNRHGLVFLSWILVFSLNIIILMRTSSILILNWLDNIKGKLSESAKTNFPNSIDILGRFSFKYAVIPFIFSGIMYVIALDWGRWLFITALSYAFCFLSPCLLDLEILNYQQNNKLLGVLSPLCSTYTKGITYLHRKSFLNRFYPIYLLALIYTLLILRLPVFNIQNSDFFTGLLHNLYQVFNS